MRIVKSVFVLALAGLAVASVAAAYDDAHRGFACADAKCKTVTPVYNSRTPLEQEQGRTGVN